ncbi:DDE-3 domain-containing protein [Mycena sanguinolenta]|uniref:DDE-3 domain-containing protein n=1 Tax=Mycena sanguinolenta TaxID=230812 RepID=A0A8H6ZFJ9_9AGAR|nr:DDE-3 domain-containing protein [Mycena sanguinolenta]
MRPQKTIKLQAGDSGVPKKGKRAIKRRKTVRGRRVTATGVLTSRGMLTSTVVEGSMHRDQFLAFLEHQVLPLCSPYPGPASILVMDNARIHHGEKVQELCDRFGVRLIYLPPYSPDLNPIEEAFSKIKSWIHRNNDIFTYGDDDEPHALIYDMMEAMNVVTELDAIGYFIHAGYF